MRKNKKIIKAAFLCCFMALFSCVKDFEDEKSTTQNTNSNVKTYFINGSQARNVASKLSNKLGKTLSNQNTTFRADDGIIVDYETIMVVENNINDIAYSLKVDSNQESETTFQNLALIEKDGQTQTKLITYEMTPEFADLYYADLKDISQFEGNITILDLSGNNCCGQNSTTFPITGGGGSSSGGYDDGIGSGGSYGDNGGASGGWGISIGGGGSGSGSSGGGGQSQLCQSGQHVRGDTRCIYTPKQSGPSNPILSNRMADPNQNITTSDPRDLCCIFDIGLYEDAMFKSDCDKLKKATQDNPTMVNDLTNLQTKTSEPIEHGIYKTSGSVTTQTAIAGQNGSVEFPNITTGQYEVMAHTHNSPADNTYSIFSWEDLETVSQMLNTNKINASKFTSFLSTADNTNYAFTITDVDKFKALYAAQQWNSSTYNQGLNAIIQTQRAINYYDSPIDNIVGKIKANSSDNISDEIAFLQMLQNLNCGITLFEVDANFTNFTKVTLDQNNINSILSEPCQ